MFTDIIEPVPTPKQSLTFGLMSVPVILVGGILLILFAEASRRPTPRRARRY